MRVYRRNTRATAVRFERPRPCAALDVVIQPRFVTAESRALLGRDVELKELTEGLDDVLGKRGRLFLVSGEPGIGKTTLADELTRVAAERGVPALWGRCWEAGGAPAYWPWLDVLTGLCGMLDDVALASALGDGAATLGAIVSSVGERLTASATAVVSGPEQARFRAFRAAAGLIKKSAASDALVIVLEDLHAADEPSLSLLHFVARELRGMRVLLLVTFREVEARSSAEVRAALAQLAREGTALSLAPLAEGAAAAWVARDGGELTPQVLQQVLGRTHGNPLFLKEMGRLLRARGPAGAVEIPSGVRMLLRQRIALVAPRTRTMLDAAAVTGDVIDPSLLAVVVGSGLDELATDLDEALAVGLIVSLAGQQFRYSHALVREVLMQDLSAARAKQLHARIADALLARSRGDDAVPHDEIAYHLLEGEASDLTQAVEHAIRAADAALSVFAFESAVTLLRRTLRAVERWQGDARLRGVVLVALGETHIRRGAGVEGQHCCKEAAALARTLGDAPLLANAALAYGLEITAALVDRELVELLQEALAALPETDSTLRVQVTARLAAALQPHHDLQYPIRLAREAIAAARRIGDTPTLLGALYTGMSAMMDIVDPRERLPHNLEVEQLAAAQGNTERLLRTQARLVFDHMELGDFRAADARIERFATLAEQAGAERFLWRVPLFRAMRAIIHGRFQEADALSRQAHALGEKASDPQLQRCYVFHREGLLRAWERHDDMLALDPEARHMRAALYSGPHWQNGGSAFTHSRVEDDVQARFYLDLVPQGDWPLVHNPPAFLHVGEPIAFVGDQAAAQMVYDLLLPARHRFVSWGWTKFIWEGPAARVLGLLAARLARWDEARAHYEDAIAKLQALDAGPFLARTTYEYGRAMCAHGGEREAAAGRRLLEQAHSAAEQLDMHGLVRLAERRLGKAPRGSVAPKAGSQIDAQSDAQRVPFALVSEGEYWALTYENVTLRLKDSLGLRYLAHLFSEPGRGIHVLQLVGGHAADGESVDTGDAGELLDEQAKQSYRRRVGELREELDEAESFGDPARAERAREELDALTAELSRAVGPGGRTRRAAGAAERARSAVQRRIKNAIDRIREAAPALGELLDRTVKTGTVCTFSPENTQPR